MSLDDYRLTRAELRVVAFARAFSEEAGVAAFMGGDHVARRRELEQKLHVAVALMNAERRVQRSKKR